MPIVFSGENCKYELRTGKEEKAIASWRDFYYVYKDNTLLFECYSEKIGIEIIEALLNRDKSSNEIIQKYWAFKQYLKV